MTDTTAMTTTQAPKPPVSSGPISALVPQDIEQAFRLAQALSQSGDMIPEVYRDKPQMIMAAILKGLEVGLAPMQALANIAVVNGRPALWGEAIQAFVLRAGHHLDCEIAGDGDARTATATLTRSNGKSIVRSFSVADAKLAKLWGKVSSTGKPSPWVLYPDRMLMMRARAFAARDGAADALMGMPMIEEVQDYGPDHARDVTPTAPRRGGAVYRELDSPAPAADELVEHQWPDADELAQAEAAALAAIQEQDEGAA